MKPFRYLSVCSGIEAATVAWHPLGWEAAAFSEIEKFPRAVLSHHYPNVPLHGDFTTIKGDEYGAVDLLVGGTPCQDFSVAGKRAGLDGARGNLTLEYARLAKRLGVEWMVWENVPGVFSNNEGRDFGAVLACFAGYPDGYQFAPPKDGWSNSGIAPPAGPEGYGLAWRVLDAQYLGVAQRRRRVFVVGYLGDWRPAAAVLLDGYCLSGNLAPSRKAGQSVAGTISSRTTGGGGLGTDFDCAGGLQPVAFGGNDTSGSIDVAAALNANRGCHNPGDFEAGTLPVENRVVSTLDASYGRLQGCSNQDANHGHSHLVPLSVALRGRDGGGTAELGDEVAGCLRASTGGGDKPHVLAPIAFDSRQDPVSSSEVFGALGSSSPQAQAVSFAIQAGALRTNPNSGPDGVGIQAEVAYTLEARSEVQCAQQGMAVRRLVPPECETLQGFPRNYTRIPMKQYSQQRITKNRPADQWEPGTDGKWWLMAADGPRYKALGNSMAVPVMAWIGRRIQIVRQILALKAAA